MQNEVSIFKCRICGKLMKRNSYQVYPGDATCCNECNREADNESAYKTVTKGSNEK